MKHDLSTQFANALAVAGSIGLVIAALVTPDQWLSAPLRPPSIWLLCLSLSCIALAAIIKRNLRFGLSVFLGVIFVASASYLGVLLFVAAKNGWRSLFGGLGLIGLALFVTASSAYAAVRYLRAPNKALKTDAPRSGARLS